MAASQELEQRLTEAGNKLLNPPTSVEELLSLLDILHDGLSKVEQSPPKSMQIALSPSQKALVADSLLKHPDEDVKVAVAASVSEVTRITAPDAPYDDELMKEVFQLIVSSFENLSDKSSRSYSKRTSILETVAKVRSCVVMLDLECDALIIEMFRHFLKAIRDYHPENVVSSMETIMTLVLEESEDISPVLLSPILDYVKKDNEEVLPISRKLAERVLQSCATKLKPYLNETVKSLGLSLDNYSDVVASICQGTSGTVEQNGSDSNEKEKEKPAEVASDELVDAPNDGCVKSVVSNGVAQTGEDNSLADSDSTKKREDGDLTDELKKPTDADTDKTSMEEADAGNEENQTTKKKGSKSNSTEQIESCKSSSVDEEMEFKSPDDDPSASVAAPSENQKEIGVLASPPKPVEDESTHVDSPSQSESLPDERHSKAVVQQNKKDSSNKEAKPSADDAAKIASEGPSDSEAKPTKKSEKKVASGSSSKKKTTVSATKKGSSSASKSKVKPLKQLEKKVDAHSDVVEESSKPKEDKKKQGHGKPTSEKDGMETSAKGAKVKPLKRLEKKVNGNSDDEEQSPKPKEDKKKHGRGKATSEKDAMETSSKDDKLKPLKQLKKKVDAHSDYGEESSKSKEDKKKQGRGKEISEKDAMETSSKDDDKEMVLSPKSATKSSKDAQHKEETPKEISKRKRSMGTEKPSEDKEYGEDLIGLRIKVWWPMDRKFYEGVVDSFDAAKKKHLILYDDGDQEILNLKRQKWEFVVDDSESTEEEAADQASPDAKSEIPQKKKAKTTGADLSAKKAKTDASAERSGGASSSKSKAAATKSSKKSKEEKKAETKSKDTSKATSKTETDSDEETEEDEKPKTDRKPSAAASKPTGKSKKDELATKPKSGTSKASAKSKDETLKSSKPKQESSKVSATTSAKGKTGKTSGKSDANDSGKKKAAASAKAIEKSDEEDSADDTPKAPETSKRNSVGSAKTPGSHAKSGKKRKR